MDGDEAGGHMGGKGTSWIQTLTPDPLIATAPPQCQPDTIARATQSLGATATAWAVQTASVAARKALGQVTRPDADGPGISEVQVRPVRRVSESCILAFLMGLIDDLPAEKVEVPPEAVQATHDTVHAGIPLERMLRTMWSAHIATLDALLSHLSELSHAPVPARAVDLALWSQEERRVRQLSFAYLEAFSDWMTREYQAERDAWAGSLSSARRATVVDIIEGRRIVTRDAEATLGVRLTDPHLALIIWAETVDSDEVLDGSLMATATAIVRAAEATSAVTVHGAPATLWTWLSWRQQPGPERIAGLGDLVSLAPGIRVAAGPVGSGRAGFRRSHRCAREAQRTSPGTASPFCHYADLAVLSLLTMNTEHARWFVEDTLGKLAGEGQRMAELRSTLHAYLSSGRSRSAAAESLHIASGTVAYRLSQAEEILGAPIAGTGRDIELALEILAAGPP